MLRTIPAMKGLITTVWMHSAQLGTTAFDQGSQKLAPSNALFNALPGAEGSQ